MVPKLGKPSWTQWLWGNLDLDLVILTHHRNLQPSLLGVISNNPYSYGLKPSFFHGFGVQRHVVQLVQQTISLIPMVEIHRLQAMF